MLVDANDTVVGGEAVLCVGPEHAHFVIGNVQQPSCFNWGTLLFDELTPFGEVWQCANWVSPLLAQKASRWVLEVQRDKKSVEALVVLRDHIRLQLGNGRGEHLAHGVTVTILFVEIAVEEVERLLGLLFEEHFLEGFQHKAALSLRGWQTAELDDSILVRLSHSLPQSGCLRHSQPLVHARDLAGLKCCLLDRGLSGAIGQAVGLGTCEDAIVLVLDFHVG